VLDFGAGDRGWEKKVRAAADRVEYRSLDEDPHTPQDYRSLDEVRGTFDLILLVEVIEHLGFAEGLSLLAKLRELLAPGGRLLLTTPNTAHPTQYWQDPTHRTAWAYDFLGAVCLELGYVDLRCFRLLNAKLPAFVATRALGWVFHRWAGFDYARTIALSAAREGS
jgi:SAM-dependent methyltransferase